MDFTSPVFLFAFLPLVLALHCLLRPVAARNGLLLVASVLFYAWSEPRFVFVLLGCAAVNAAFARAMEEWRAQADALLAAGVGFNILILVYFKYAHFLVFEMARWVGVHASWATIGLPLAVSFFTFHAITYIVAVYRREAPAQRNPAWVALYIFFFPQLIAGPIVRYPAIAPALARRRVRAAMVAAGIRQFVRGLAKKVLIANVLAAPADQAFGLSASDLSAPTAWWGVLCYALQIFFDFSGYSDMALGLAQMFGFRFPVNFNHPYVSRSVREFWRRWHISLSTFFRDYLYIPLGGGRGTPEQTAFNLVLVFCLCGLWHGASWTFLVWGLFHGVFIALERTRMGRLLRSAPGAVGWTYTMLVVLVGWVYFRSNTIAGANVFLQSMFLGRTGGSPLPLAMLMDRETVVAVLAGCLLSTPVWPLGVRALVRRGRTVAAVRWADVAITFGLFILSVVWVAGETYTPFIYFRF